MKLILLIFALMSLSSCAIINELGTKAQNGSRRIDSFLDKPTSELYSAMGTPAYTVEHPPLVFSYYRKTIFTSENGIVKSWASYGGDTYDIQVESYSDGFKEKPVATIVSGIKDLPTDSLEFKEAERVVRFLLEQSGYEIVEPNSKKGFQEVVLVNFGITDPIVDYKVWSEPVFTWIPGHSTTTTVSTYGGTAHVTTSSPGTLSYAGERVYSQKFVNYLRYLSIESIDAQAYLKSKKIKKLWKTTATSIGYSSDVRAVVQSMIYNSYPYWSKSTPRKEKIVVYKEDPIPYEISQYQNRKSRTTASKEGL